MPDTLTTFDAISTQASTIDPAEAFWRSIVTAHSAFDTQAQATEDTDPHWKSPIFESLSAATNAAEAALMDIATTTPLGILRKLELLASDERLHLRDRDDAFTRIVGSLIRDLRRSLGMPDLSEDDPLGILGKWN